VLVSHCSLPVILLLVIENSSGAIVITIDFFNQLKQNIAVHLGPAISCCHLGKAKTISQDFI